MIVVLDTGVLGDLCHPRAAEASERQIQRLIAADPSVVICIPEIADYELRRKLIHRNAVRSISRLDAVTSIYQYLPITTAVMRRAAELWAANRKTGRPSADDRSLDGDVILAAQAEGQGGTVVTNNRKHLEHIVPVLDWSQPLET